MFTIAGATQVTGLDAGLQPISDLVVDRLPMQDACEGFARTGTAPFDPAPGPGRQDTGSDNCIVRTNDTVTQQFSVSLTGLPTGASVPNVVFEFTIASPDGGAVELAGPGASGIPTGCLTAAAGEPGLVAHPQRGRLRHRHLQRRHDVVECRRRASVIRLRRQHLDSRACQHHRAGVRRCGEAGVATPVSGPVVEVTGTASWDLTRRWSTRPTQR